MAQKENKGGRLTNTQIEEDNKAKGKADKDQTSYVGSQDTGDDRVRQFGTEVQRRDGLPDDASNESREGA